MTDKKFNKLMKDTTKEADEVPSIVDWNDTGFYESEKSLEASKEEG